MTSLYSQIKKYLDYGLMVVVVDESEDYRVFIHMNDDGIAIQLGGFSKTIEKALKSKSMEIKMETFEEAERLGYKIHSLIPRPITPYPVGMKVRVDEGYRKANIKSKWVTDEEPVTIEKVVLNDNGTYEYELSDNSEIDHRFLIPVLEEEKEWNGFKLISTKEDWIKEGRTRGWIKGGEVIE